MGCAALFHLRFAALVRGDAVRGHIRAAMLHFRLLFALFVLALHRGFQTGFRAFILALDGCGVPAVFHRLFRAAFAFNFFRLFRAALFVDILYLFGAAGNLIIFLHRILLIKWQRRACQSP